MIHQKPQILDTGSFEPALFRQMMRSFASTVTIIASGKGEGRRGLTATSVCSLSDHPPSIMACINKASETYKAIVKTRAFSMNIASIEHGNLAGRFAGRQEMSGADKFRPDEWVPASKGPPMLLGAVAFADCLAARILDGGTHAIIIGFVRRATFDPTKQPLIYHAGSFTTLCQRR